MIRGDDVLLALKKAHLLSTLILSGYTATELVFIDFLKARGYGLKSLCLAWSGALLTSSVLEAIGTFCKNLEKLDIRGVPNSAESDLIVYL